LNYGPVMDMTVAVSPLVTPTFIYLS